MTSILPSQEGCAERSSSEYFVVEIIKQMWIAGECPVFIVLEIKSKQSFGELDIDIMTW
jgi:hypothetical protein